MKDFTRLLKYLRPHLLIFVLAFVAMILGALFEVAVGAMITPIFNQAFPNGAGQKSATLFGLQKLIPDTNWSEAWFTIGAMLLTFTICKGISEFFSSYLMAKIGQSAVLQLRQELYDHLLKQ